MQFVTKTLVVLAVATVGSSLPRDRASFAIGSATLCKYMVPWQVEKPGYKWIWACKEDCIYWQLSDPSHPECLLQVPVEKAENSSH
ncbi:hypothetical protein BB8028_0005g10060 [Beauveria bassiana]|uniref:Secreted protein n=1 Tax=Beauveria bassiana TaxID=176275 RepID=A0A2S7YHR6_BEABA|nr:hypothetical protein BB8028_0005g10060 [Beauveria bassiana]